MNLFPKACLSPEIPEHPGVHIADAFFSPALQNI
jgi:hypothetical protein